ncbi:MAG: hypothetical protein IT293_05290 [Deltaproteobacteria bacterium]|nr:hypothetical protein [Deltaproteobacteria bacterium]
MQVELTDRARRALEALQPESEPGAAIEAVTLDALRSRLRDCLAEIGAFEARYGCPFEDLAREWGSRPSGAAHAHAAERDYMEWEALTMERAEILALLRELTTAPRAPV